MPIEPKRIEAAARAKHERSWIGRCIGHPMKWEDVREGERTYLIGEMMQIAADLFPELASDPPTAWVAPWEATEAMAVAGLEHDRDIGGPALPNDQWTVMRDAYPKEQTCAVKPLDADLAKVWDDNIDKLYES